MPILISFLFSIEQLLYAPGPGIFSFYSLFLGLFPICPPDFDFSIRKSYDPGPGYSSSFIFFANFSPIVKPTFYVFTRVLIEYDAGLGFMFIYILLKELENLCFGPENDDERL